MEMIKKQITLPDGRTLIYFSFPKNDNNKDSKRNECEKKCCCGGDK
ncbi:MAG: hypothetical protein ABFD83_10450 [Armatimonadota bacterium]